MKKTLFFTILFSILSVSMFGQLNISLHAKESNGINCGNTITRCYNSDHDVTTYFKGGKTYIDLVEISTQLVFNIDIMSDIEIMDMYVFKEKLFFCGRDSQRHWGIVGYLDIPDMQLLMPVTVTYFYVYSVL